MKPNNSPAWEPPPAPEYAHTIKPLEYVGYTFKAFKSKGIELIGELTDARHIPINQRDQVPLLVPDGYFFSFVWQYWTPGGFSSIIIERGLKFYTHLDVDNAVDLCGKLFTIRAWRNLSTKISRNSTSCEHEPYIKILHQDSINGVSLDLSTIPQD